MPNTTVRIQCLMCDKDYLSRRGLRRHVLSIHRRRYTIGRDGQEEAHELASEDLEDALMRLHR